MDLHRKLTESSVETYSALSFILLSQIYYPLFLTCLSNFKKSLKKTNIAGCMEIQTYKKMAQKRTNCCLTYQPECQSLVQQETTGFFQQLCVSGTSSSVPNS